MTRGLLGAVLALILASPALAQATNQSPTGNLEKLSSFRSTGTVEPKPIPQEGRKADALRRNLDRFHKDQRHPGSRRASQVVGFASERAAPSTDPGFPIGSTARWTILFIGDSVHTGSVF